MIPDTPDKFDRICSEVRQCTLCADELPLGPNPVFSISPKSRILIIGQAPGTRVHATGIPWNDPSGIQLRKWLGVSDEQFYDPDLFGIVPMGLCYPGSGKSGDLPPRPECAPQWHDTLFKMMPDIQLKVLIGQYSQAYYLKDKKAKTLTETVLQFEDHLPDHFVLPHPSPRNRIWLKRNPWFERDVIPVLQGQIEKILESK